MGDVDWEGAVGGYKGLVVVAWMGEDGQKMHLWYEPFWCLAKSPNPRSRHAARYLQARCLIASAQSHTPLHLYKHIPIHIHTVSPIVGTYPCMHQHKTFHLQTLRLPVKPFNRNTPMTTPPHSTSRSRQWRLTIATSNNASSQSKFFLSHRARSRAITTSMASTVNTQDMATMPCLPALECG